MKEKEPQPPNLDFEMDPEDEEMYFQVRQSGLGREGAHVLALGHEVTDRPTGGGEAGGLDTGGGTDSRMRPVHPALDHLLIAPA